MCFPGDFWEKDEDFDCMRLLEGDFWGESYGVLYRQVYYETRGILVVV
jgi:hypothetical protein